ncbi:MAG: hypothetical protein IKO77_01770 [Bacteroidales bacterium]|nr:hypothetical protein [Bacteroidales bacterium]
MRRPLIIMLLALSAAACTSSRLSQLARRATSAELTLPEAAAADRRDPAGIAAETIATERDTILTQELDESGVFVMNAVRDDESGDMIASDVIQAATVTARFRHVAERHGKVHIAFRINVPSDLLDSRWQLRFSPVLQLPDGNVPLEEIYITGQDYRKAQLRGYQQYERYLRSLTRDSLYFVLRHQLDRFISRNIPELYAMRNDTTYVSDERFASAFGVTGEEALKHYTNEWIIRYNRHRIENRDKVFARLVKVPIRSEGLHLDTVIRHTDSFSYDYSLTLDTSPALRKVGVTLEGALFEQEKECYHIPASEPLTFYISSLSTLAEERERYLTQIISRQVCLEATYTLAFEPARYDLRSEVAGNQVELIRISQNLRQLLESRELVIDSILVTASASPEGAFTYNSHLSRKRGESVCRYFESLMRFWADSIRREAPIVIGLADADSIPEKSRSADEIPFSIRTLAENWTGLDSLVRFDSSLTEVDRAAYFACRGADDEDLREALMKRNRSYAYIRQELYPRLRTVRFDFHLHRRGMIQDTIQTTVPDTVYRSGLQALKERDYQRAASILRPYGDYNTAVAFCASGKDLSALELLGKMEPSARVNYMLALIYSRNGDKPKALDCYRQACLQDPAYVHRGNLDPEISTLIY